MTIRNLIDYIFSMYTIVDIRARYVDALGTCYGAHYERFTLDRAEWWFCGGYNDKVLQFKISEIEESGLNRKYPIKGIKIPVIDIMYTG